MPDTFIQYAQQRTLENGGSLVVLTPDDILTLKLLRDNFHRQRMDRNTNDRLDIELDRKLNTLERILKQIQ